MSHSRAIPAYPQAADIPAYTAGASPSLQERPTVRSLHGASLFPGSGLCSGTPPAPLTPPIPLPSLKVPLPPLLPLGFCRGQSSCTTCTLTAPEQWRNMKNGRKMDTGSVSHHNAPLLDTGSTGDAQHSFQAGTTPPSTDAPVMAAAPPSPRLPKGICCSSRAGVFG